MVQIVNGGCTQNPWNPTTTNASLIYQTGKTGNLVSFLLQMSTLYPRQIDAPEEFTGPFRTVYAWKQIDFTFPTIETRRLAVQTKRFIPQNNLPLGLEIFENRIFITLPKWRPGVPATLAYIPKSTSRTNPKLIPYPDWNYHTLDTSCMGLTSVFRVQADHCRRLWVLDSGQIDIRTGPKQICPPTIFIFNLDTNLLLYRYALPKEFIKEDSLYSNIAIDYRDPTDCSSVHAYLTDVWRFGLVVFNLKSGRSWRISDHLFYPEPLAAQYQIHDLRFEWTDGLFGIALSPFNTQKPTDRLLYFHPMSSFREFAVRTSVICNETGWNQAGTNAFYVLGQSRGKSGHISASGVDRNGIMFFNLVTRDAIGCWDTRKPYKRTNLEIIAKNRKTLIFPSDLKLDTGRRQNVWILSNRLPFFMYRGLNKDTLNFRILSARVDQAIEGTICDPKVFDFDTFIKYPTYEDCY